MFLALSEMLDVILSRRWWSVALPHFRQWSALESKVLRSTCLLQASWLLRFARTGGLKKPWTRSTWSRRGQAACFHMFLWRCRSSWTTAWRLGARLCKLTFTLLIDHLNLSETVWNGAVILGVFLKQVWNSSETAWNYLSLCSYFGFYFWNSSEPNLEPFT